MFEIGTWHLRRPPNESFAYDGLGRLSQYADARVTGTDPAGAILSRAEFACYPWATSSKRR